MDRLERLVNLVAALIDAEHPLSREEIRHRIGGYAAETPAFRRAFERDKEILRQMGMPLVTEPLDPDRPDDQVGYRIPRERYELPDPGLDDDELAALRLAASAVAVEGPWGEEASASALRKLAGTATRPSAPAPPRPGTWPQTDLAVPAGDRVVTAFAAVAERRRVTFAYRGQERTVEPWRLTYRKGQWYLQGLDHSRGEERLFRLDRVDGTLSAVGSAGAFERPELAAVEPPAGWRLGDGEEIPVEIAVDGPYAPFAVDEVGEAAVRERSADGSVRIVLPVTNVGGLRSFVLGLLEHAEVLGPPEVRADVVDWLQDLAVGP
jgi:predicted DNA-binding transcriptional regulator YafY